MASAFGVITTIQLPTESAKELAILFRRIDSKLIVVGDQKGPPSYDLDGVEFLPLDAQLESGFELASRLPTGHYARKNVGYLRAISQGASCIYETDDDNAPLDTWKPRAETLGAAVSNDQGWVNIYRAFSGQNVWPRGFPLDEIGNSLRRTPDFSMEAVKVRAPIQQGLANDSPDVDAVWRLALDEPIRFEPRPSVFLRPGAWCPFNSQSTWWFPMAYPLMYLPSFCSFRMTDIWRSFIAQRCLWELDLGVAFHGPEVVQQRNEHDLMRDFEDEIPGYLGNKKMVTILENLMLSKGADAVGANLLKCYEELVRAEFFQEKELDLVHAWLADLDKAGSN